MAAAMASVASSERRMGRMESALPLQAERTSSKGRAGAGKVTCEVGGSTEGPGRRAGAAAIGKQEVTRCLHDLEFITKLPLRQISKLLLNFLKKLKIYKNKSYSPLQALHFSCFDLFKFYIIFEI
jgi:hypothetical protein